MQIKEIMTKNVITVEPDTRIAKVAEILFQNRIHAVPVMEGEKIAGIIAENDLFTRDSRNVFLPSYINFMEGTKMADKLNSEDQAKLDKLMNIEAKDIMSKNCFTIKEDADISSLLEIFRTTKYATVPVMNNEEKLVGIVTIFDIVGLIKSQLNG
jgi:CBS domain-containing protein